MMRLNLINEFFKILAAVSMLTATTAVNSACCLIVYEEKMPIEAMELIREK